MKHLFSIAVLALLWVCTAGPSLATSHGTSASAGQRSTLADGEVRKVDKEAKKLTIRHGPIKNLDMPAMTMVFQVKDAAMLDAVKAGDKVRFAADKLGGAYTVTQLESVK